MAQRWFDANGATAGFGTLTGNWNAALWTANSAGTSATSTYTFTSADEALFGQAAVTGTAGTVTIPTGVAVTLNKITTANLAAAQTITYAGTGSLTFAGTTPTISVGSAGGLNFGVPINMAAGNTLTISSGSPGFVTSTGFSGALNYTTSAVPIWANNYFPNATSLTWTAAAPLFLFAGTPSSTAITINYPMFGPSRLQFNDGSGTMTINLNGSLAGITGTPGFGGTGNSAGPNVGLAPFATDTVNRVVNMTYGDWPSQISYYWNYSSASAGSITVNYAPTSGGGGTFATPLYLIPNNPLGVVASNIFNANQPAGQDLTLTGGIVRVGSVGTATMTLSGTTTSTNTISGNILQSDGASAILAISKTGATTWVFSGSGNAYTGGTTVSGGTLRGTVAAAFGTGSVTMSGTPTVELIGGNSYANVINAVGTIRNVSGSNTLTGGITLAGTTTLESQAGTLTVSAGAVSGGGAVGLTLSGAGDHVISSTVSGINLLTKNGAGTSLLSGTANSFVGNPTINAGVLEAKALANSGSNSSIGAGSSIPFGTSSTGFLKYTGTSVATTNRGLSFTGSTAAGLDSSATNEFNSTTFSGAISTTGSNTIALKGSNTGYNTLSAALTGAHGFTKSEAGRWILKGANDLTGTTIVSAGRLVASNNSYNNKLLGGSVTVQAGGEIQLGAEGDQKGRCAYTNLTVGGTSGNRAKIRIGGTATSPTVYLNGNLALPTGSDKTNWDLTSDTFKTPGTYTLFAFGTGFGVTGGTVASNVLATYPSGRSGVLSYNVGSPNTITVTIS